MRHRKNAAGVDEADSVEIVRRTGHELDVDGKPSMYVQAQQPAPVTVHARGADALSEFRALQQRAAELIAQADVPAPGPTAAAVATRLLLALLALAVCAAVVVLVH